MPLHGFFNAAIFFSSSKVHIILLKWSKLNLKPWQQSFRQAIKSLWTVPLIVVVSQIEMLEKDDDDDDKSLSTTVIEEEVDFSKKIKRKGVLTSDDMPPAPSMVSWNDGTDDASCCISCSVNMGSSMSILSLDLSSACISIELDI